MDLSNQDLTFLSWLRPSKGSWGPILNLEGNSNFLDFLTKLNNMGVYGLPWTSTTKIWHFWADSNPPEGPGVQFQNWREIQFFLISSQYPIIWVSMDSHRPQQPRFDLLSWLAPWGAGCEGVEPRSGGAPESGYNASKWQFDRSKCCMSKVCKIS